MATGYLKNPIVKRTNRPRGFWFWRVFPIGKRTNRPRNLWSAAWFSKSRALRLWPTTWLMPAMVWRRQKNLPLVGMKTWGPWVWLKKETTKKHSFWKHVSFYQAVLVGYLVFLSHSHFFSCFRELWIFEWGVIFELNLTLLKGKFFVKCPLAFLVCKLVVILWWGLMEKKLFQKVYAELWVEESVSKDSTLGGFNRCFWVALVLRYSKSQKVLVALLVLFSWKSHNLV